MKSKNPEQVMYLNFKDAQRVEKPCAVCKLPILVAVGEDAHYHRNCRRFRHNRSKYAK